MAKIQESRAYEGKTADACFGVEAKAFERAGFQVWKKRDFAWLVQAQLLLDHKKIEANLTARPGPKATVTLSLNCDTMGEADLKPYAEKIFGAFEAELRGS